MFNPYRANTKEEAKPTRRSVLMPVLVALAGVTVVAAYLYWEEMTRMPPPVGRIGTLAQSMPPGEDPSGRAGEDWSSLMPTDGQRLLAVHPGDRSLSPTEAALPPHPQAQGFMGVRRTAEGIVEEYAFYRVPGVDIEAVRVHCRQAALAAGFVPVDSAAVASTSMLFTRLDPPDRGGDMPTQQTLIVRASVREGEVRTTAWLRYAIPSSR